MKNTARPTIYEINTPIFLREVGLRVGRSVTLADVPDEEWDAIARPGINTVWFMGVWKRSQIAKEMAKDDVSLRVALPDLQDEDLLGSAYSIQEYTVDDLLGGNDGLAVARGKLRERGLGIMLDYVPNHVAIDHHWAAEHPDFFVAGTEQDLASQPGAFIQTPGGIFAKGKDPNYEPWSDVLQLNAFSPSLRQEVAATLQRIAGMCDGIRCDMAMLMLNTIFKHTWGDRVGDIPAADYWPAIISAVHQVHPTFLFLAEVYWDKQQDLLDQGFDLCYDKDLYDLLIHGSVHQINTHLQKPVSFQNHLLRFIENHDEARAAHVFRPNKHCAAAVIMATLPGAHLYYDGQREGRRVKIPVHLGRRPDEPVNTEIADFYDHLFRFVADKNFEQGTWRLLSVSSKLWRRPSHRVVAWTWTTDDSQYVVAINYSHEKAKVTLDVDMKKALRAETIIEGVVDLPRYLQGSRVLLDAWQHVVIQLKK